MMLFILPVCAILLLVLIISYICFVITFRVSKNDPVKKEEYPIPVGKIYEPWRDVMVQWMKETRAMPHKEFSIRSFDGLLLKGKYYEFSPDAPIELMMHGYRGAADRDLCGGVQRCFALGHNALVVDQRACGSSEGKVITFGVLESRDCLDWVNYLVTSFGKDVKIILTGISMGASTVLMAGGQPLPENVIGILADCGFTSARDIIKEVIRVIKLPSALAYPFVRLGARLYGNFDLEQDSAIEAVKRCRVPVIFFHGEDDDFVPCRMSVENHEACASKKKLVTIPGAGHGLSFLMDPARYLTEMSLFFQDPNAPDQSFIFPDQA